MGTTLYEKLKNTSSAEEIRSAFFLSSGQEGLLKGKSDATERVLYVFKRDKKLKETGLVALIGKALYLLREIRYGSSAAPLPSYICGVCKEEAFLISAEPFARFYEKKKTEKYDFDRAPNSPCPKLLDDLQAFLSQKGVRVYDLKNGFEENAFLGALFSARAVQTSVFSGRKKKIDEENFHEVFLFWSAQFSAFLEEGKGARKLSAYFLYDIEKGKTLQKNGKAEFVFGEEKVVKSLPVYEYNSFWNLYERVTDEETLFAIRRKIDRLSEDFARRFEGEFYTPTAFAQKAYEYIEKTVGKKKLESGNYRIWDMAAGSGNLEFVLPAAALPYTYISTLGDSDAEYCKRIFPNSTVFQYDYLNDDVELLFGEKASGETDGEKSGEKGSATAKMPKNLIEDLRNPKLKWLIFINPPFATSNLSSLAQGKTSKTGVSDTQVRKQMIQNGYGETGRELFSQFLYRIHKEFENKKLYLGLFSTLKYLNAPNDKKLREGFFRYRIERGFIFSSENFEGSKGKFPVAFGVWQKDEATSPFGEISFDVFDKNAKKVGVKKVFASERPLLSGWTKRPPTKYVFPPFTGGENIATKNADVRDRVAEGFLCSLMCCGNDFQHLNQTALFSGPQASAGSFSVTAENFERAMATHAVRRLPKPTWSNNRDQFYAPSEEPSEEFFVDCAVWNAFSDSNNARSFESVEYKGNSYRVKNHLFPFSKADVTAWGYALSENEKEEDESYLYEYLKDKTLSKCAEALFVTAKELFAYVYTQKSASVFDEGFAQIKQKIAGDARGEELLASVKSVHKVLGEKLLKEGERLGFIPEDVRYFDEEAK